ncbi:NUDIX domain-containing protein [Patescibacteria group bacterium]
MENKKIHLGVYCLVRRDDELLVIKKGRGPYIGKYDLPGGRLEFGESIEDGLRRELQEETGLEMMKASFLSVEEDVF